MTERRINVAQSITYPDGTMQPAFRDFIFRVDQALGEAGLSAVWGQVGGTLTNQSDLSAALNAKADVGDYSPPAVRDEATDPYTLVLGDANSVLRFTTADAAVTIPQEASVNFPVGTEVSIRQAGTGTLVLTTTGLTINGTIPSWAQHTEVKFRKVGSDEWDVV